MNGYIKTFISQISNNKYDGIDSTEFYECLPYLKKVNFGLDINDIIIWFNENKIDYNNMSDLDMYIYYIEKNSKIDDL